MAITMNQNDWKMKRPKYLHVTKILSETDGVKSYTIDAEPSWEGLAPWFIDSLSQSDIPLSTRGYAMQEIKRMGDAMEQYYEHPLDLMDVEEVLISVLDKTVDKDTRMKAQKQIYNSARFLDALRQKQKCEEYGGKYDTDVHECKDLPQKRDLEYRLE